MRGKAALLVAAAANLAGAGEAGAHVVPDPAFVAARTAATITLTLPNERPGHATVGLTVRLPTGFQMLGAAAPPPWVSETTQAVAIFRGGRLEGASTAAFSLELRAGVDPGSVTFSATQRYEDGEHVDWRVPLTVVPAAEPSKGRSARTLGAAVGAFLVLAASALVVVRARRGRD
ncbi:MAG: DUF1775 domain-containing protein [Gaiellales bacterium]